MSPDDAIVLYIVVGVLGALLPVALVVAVVVSASRRRRRQAADGIDVSGRDATGRPRG